MSQGNQSVTLPKMSVRVAASIDHQLLTEVSALTKWALKPEERDDRFDAWAEEAGASTIDNRDETLVAAVVSDAEGSPLAYVGGTIDAIDSSGTLGLEVLAHSGDGPNGLTEIAAVTLALDALDARIEKVGATRIEFWGRPARDWHKDLSQTFGLDLIRVLFQMRKRLPVQGKPAPTRAFDRSTDLEQILEINNRAFASHPDQGALTINDLEATMSQPWFQPEGIRIHERDGVIAGFCWTKIHRTPPPAADLGEIYVLGVDPAFQGQGLGVSLTTAGLKWLHQQGLSVGMLYVESNNEPAIRTYHSLGFDVVRTDKAWARDLNFPVRSKTGN